MALNQEALTALTELLSVKQVADMFDVPARVVRRDAKNGNIPGTVKVLGKVGFDPALVADWTPPEVGTRVVGTRREDGRKRYRIYLSEAEHAELVAQGREIIDPSVAAKARRAARKAAKAAAAGDAGAAPAVETKDGDSDPFADFGA